MEVSAIKVGGVYEGSRGELRTVLMITKPNRVFFHVTKQAHGKGQRLLLGEARAMPMKKFAAWAEKAL